MNPLTPLLFGLCDCDLDHELTVVLTVNCTHISTLADFRSSFILSDFFLGLSQIFGGLVGHLVAVWPFSVRVGPCCDHNKLDLETISDVTKTGNSGLLTEPGSWRGNLCVCHKAPHKHSLNGCRN